MVSLEDPERENLVKLSKGLSQPVPERPSVSELIYTFGGINRAGEPNNIMWTLKFEGLGYNMRLVNSIGKKPEPRYAHSMTLLDPLNLVVVYGGKNEGQREFFKDLYIFVPESTTWSHVAVEGEPLPGLANASISGYNNEVFIFGGATSEGYSPFNVYRATLRKEKNMQIRLKQKILCLRFIDVTVGS